MRSASSYSPTEASPNAVVPNMDFALMQSATSPRLPHEILAMIFQEIWGEASAIPDSSRAPGSSRALGSSRASTVFWLRQMRVLSRGLNELLLPLAFERVDLKGPRVLRNLIGHDPFNTQWHEFEGHVIQYTKTLGVCSTTMKSRYFNAPGILRFLSESRLLRVLEWDFTGYRNRSNAGLTAFNLMTAFFENQHILIIDISTSTIQLQRSNIQQKIRVPKHNNKKSPAQAPSQTLRITCTPDAYSFYTSSNFPFRYPATTKLKLHNYKWRNSSEEYLRRFDFSQLERLSLHNVNMFNFLSSVPVQHLEKLKSLKIHITVDCYDETFEDDEAHLFDSLFFRLTRMTKLDIQFYGWEIFVPPNIVSRASALQTLRLVSDINWEDDMPMNSEELNGIRLGCPDLRSLKMDWSAAYEETEKALAVLIRFNNLETLTLCAWNSLASRQAVDSTDPEYDTAMAMIQQLMNEKQGKPFKSISIVVENLYPPSLWVMQERAKGITNPKIPRTRVFAVAIENGVVVETGDKRVEDVED